MKLIEDLGMHEYGTQGRKKRYAIYECTICKKHFECSVDNVKSKNTTKCRTCADTENGLRKAQLAAQSFVVKSKEVHGDTYDYSKVIYTTAIIKVKILCKIHGIFEQTPSDHIRGAGCPRCNGIIASKEEASSTFIAVSVALHGDKYDYTEVEYKTASTKVHIICKEHGVFMQTPASHKRGDGCPKCAVHGFNKEKNAIMYYIKVKHNDDTLYKIGITNKTIIERFTASDRSKISVIAIWEFAVGVEAYNKEQELLQEHSAYKYTGDTILSSGNTELFTHDVLGLDYLPK